MGSPRTHQKFLHREDGTYGPVPMRPPRGILNMPFNTTDVKNLYCAGDSTFPGQGVNAVVFSGFGAAHRALVDQAGRRRGRWLTNFSTLRCARCGTTHRTIASRSPRVLFKTEARSNTEDVCARLCNCHGVQRSRSARCRVQTLHYCPTPGAWPTELASEPCYPFFCLVFFLAFSMSRTSVAFSWSAAFFS